MNPWPYPYILCGGPEASPTEACALYRVQSWRAAGSALTPNSMGDAIERDVRPWLDLIEALRQEGVQEDLPLPQIAVMGTKNMRNSHQHCVIHLSIGPYIMGAGTAVAGPDRGAPPGGRAGGPPAPTDRRSGCEENA
jgi:hypothetical protein